MQVRQLLEKREKEQVIATCRDPSRAASLQELKSRYSERLDILKLDVTDESTIQVAMILIQCGSTSISEISLKTWPSA